MVGINVKPFGVNAEQQYLTHLQQIIHIQDIYKLVEADTEYIDLFAKHKIEEVEGWGCRLLFTRPKPGLDHNIELSVHNKDSGFVRTVDIAYVDIPCKIDKLYYDNVHQSRWVDAIGDYGKCGEIETQLKDNISTEMTEDINIEVENAFSDKNHYRKGEPDNSKKLREIANGEVSPTGNYYFLEKDKMNDMTLIIDFLWAISSKFKSRNTIFQKGYHYDHDEPRTEDKAWKQVPTNTPFLKRIGIVCDSSIINKMATDKMVGAFNPKFIDMRERFAWVKETNFKNVLLDGKKHKDYKGWDQGGDKKFEEVYAKEKLLIWMGDVRVPVLKIREPKQGLEHKYEMENGLHWFAHKSRVYVGLATCLNYIGIFGETSDGGTV